MTADCLRLDDYLDGRLPEPEAELFESHTASCPTCDTALDDVLALPELALLREETCPPAVLEAALVAARPARRPRRRAGDRRATRLRPVRWAAISVGLAALLALAAGLSLRESVATSEPATVAEAPLAEPPSPTIAPAVPDEEVDDIGPEPPQPVPQAEEPSVSPAPEAPTPIELAQAVEAPPAPDEPEPTPEEIEAARQEIALAFALVADAQDRANDALRGQSGPVAAIIQALPF